MKNKILSSIVFVAIVSFAIGCKPKAQEVVAVDKEAIKKEIEAMETNMANMYNMRSAASEEYYADDAVSFSQNKPPLEGKLAIDTSIKEDLATFPKGDIISFAVKEIYPSSDGNQVVEIGSYKVVDANDSIKFKGNYMSLFVKRDGKYVCIRDMGASDMPKRETK